MFSCHKNSRKPCYERNAVKWLSSCLYHWCSITIQNLQGQVRAFLIEQWHYFWLAFNMLHLLKAPVHLSLNFGLFSFGLFCGSIILPERIFFSSFYLFKFSLINWVCWWIHWAIVQKCLDWECGMQSTFPIAIFGKICMWMVLYAHCCICVCALTSTNCIQKLLQPKWTLQHNQIILEDRRRMGNAWVLGIWSIWLFRAWKLYLHFHDNEVCHFLF